MEGSTKAGMSVPESNRALAAAAVVLTALTVVIGVVSAVQQFPRALIVIALVLLAMGLGWHGLLRRGAVRAGFIAAAAVCLVAGVVLLLSREPLDTVLLVLVALGAVACGRAAIVSRTHLPPAARPARPVLIFNPRSGGGKATKFDLARQARERRIEPVEMKPDLKALTEELLAQGADAVAVAGGDGSQAQVAAVVARANVPYACIPAGTRNHFALDLGVDRDDVVGALDAFVDGGERVVDLAEVNGQVFVNNVSVGLYGDAVQQAGYRDAKLRTILDTLPEVAGPDGERQRLQWREPDGSAHDGGLALMVSNNSYRLGRVIGSGTRPALDRGQLGISVIGRRRDRGLMRSWSLPSLEVDGGDKIAVGIDGEAAELDAPLQFRSRPGALRVRIARQHPGCSPSAGMPDGSWDGMMMLVRMALTGQRSSA
jgi:Diacylglycerol kinase catalytic domain